MNDETNTRARVIYSDDLCDLIFNRIIDGEALSRICADDDMPTRKMFYEWLKNDEQLQKKYALATEIRADKLAEDILQIADDGANDTYLDEDGNSRTDHDVVARSRLRVDARKWLASKMAPKKYGDKLAVGGDDSMPALKIEKIERVIVAKKANDATHK